MRGAHNWKLRHCLSNSYTLFYYLDAPELYTIDKAIQEFERKTCLLFHTGKTRHPAIHIHKRNITRSIVGRRVYIRATQALYLSAEILRNVGDVIHLLMHAIGFFHQQQASNRDRYVEIIWDNIESAYLHEFVKMNKTAMPDYDIEYDYDSIMHSPSHAFSKNGRRTIIPTVSHMKITLTK